MHALCLVQPGNQRMALFSSHAGLHSSAVLSSVGHPSCFNAKHLRAAHHQSRGVCQWLHICFKRGCQSSEAGGIGIISAGGGGGSPEGRCSCRTCALWSSSATGGWCSAQFCQASLPPVWFQCKTLWGAAPHRAVAIASGCTFASSVVASPMKAVCANFF